jgi:phospholipid transport system transporter-binding protein
MSPSSNERKCLSVKEDLHISRIDELRAMLSEQLGAEGDIELDLSGVTACDTASVQLFVSLKKSAQARSKCLRIVAPPTAFQETLRTLGLSLEDLLRPVATSS